MNKAIDKYIYAVIRRCPEDKRNDIKKELESNIYDMLSDEPTDLEIENVLHQLGNPIFVAAKYQDEEKYVVSPFFYQDYIMVLKWALIGFGCLAIMVSAIQALTLNTNDLNVWNLIGSIFSQTLENLTSFLLSAFAIVTLIFWSLNLPKAKGKVKDWLDNWKVSELMDVPQTKKEEKKQQGRWMIFFEMFFAILFQTFFVVGFIAYNHLIGIYINGTMVSPIFGDGFIDSIKWFLIIGLALSFFFYGFYLKAGRKNVPVMVFYTIHQLFNTIVAFVFMLHPNFLSPLFFQELGNIFTQSPETVENFVRNTIVIIVAIIFFVTLIDLAYQWYKNIFKKNKANA